MPNWMPTRWELVGRFLRRCWLAARFLHLSAVEERLRRVIVRRVERVVEEGYRTEREWRRFAYQLEHWDLSGEETAGTAS